MSTNSWAQAVDEQEAAAESVNITQRANLAISTLEKDYYFYSAIRFNAVVYSFFFITILLHHCFR